MDIRNKPDTINKSSNEVSFQFGDKIKSLPVVNSTCYWLSESYNRIKERNFVTKCTCGLAETTLKSSIYLATPIVNKFKSQVNALDSIACNQLDKLETAFPIIKSKPDAIVSQSKELLNKTVEPAVTRYTSFKTNTEQKCKSVKEYYLNGPLSLNNNKNILKLISLMQSFIENYFIYEQISTTPNMERVEEFVQVYLDYKDKLNTKKELNYENLIKHIKVLTYVLFYSLEAKLTKHSNESFKVLKSCFYRMFKLFEYYDLVKQNMSQKLQDKFHVTKDKIDLYKEYLDVLSKQFTVQDGRQLNQINSLEERTKVIIRRCLGNLIILFHLIYTKVYTIVPIVESKFSFINSNLHNLYQIYHKHRGQLSKALVEAFLDEFTKFSNSFQRCVNTCMSYLNSSPTVLWFVPQFDSFGILYDENDENSTSTTTTNQQNFMFLNHHNNSANTDEMNNIFCVPTSLFALGETKTARKSNVLELALLFQ